MSCEEKKDATPAEIDPSVLVPQLEGVTYGEMETAVKVLEAVSALQPPKKKKRKAEEDTSYLEIYKHTNLRRFRKALAKTLDLHQSTYYSGKSEDQHYAERVANRTLKRQKQAEKDKQRLHIQNTQLRQGRIDRLEKLKDSGKEEEEQKLLLMMVPDGHVETAAPKLLTNGDQPKVSLPYLRSCYVCKVRYRDLHSFYDQLCPDCAATNWQKRHQTCNLEGKVAVVTGSRVKIGFQVVLKLLRAGCTVIATTRFPNAAVASFRKEEDFDDFCPRLHVYGLDLRDVAGLEAFVRFLQMQYTSIDILINNACQTIRRPAGYYRPMVESEQELWQAGDEKHRKVLEHCLTFEKVRRRVVLDHEQAATGSSGRDAKPAAQLLPAATAASSVTVETVEGEPMETEPSKAVVVTLDKTSSGDIAEIETPFEKTGVSHSTAMSQMVVLEDDAGVREDVLPRGLSDINGQQLDVRTCNSWLLDMSQVSTPELLECMFVNAIAPFVLNSRLQPLMMIPEKKRPDRFIINVSAMEGKFYRFKTDRHPHTNMAKAALNMLTRTSAESLAKKHRIYMNSVDTGWINDENPLEKASKIAKENNFQTPIDEIDAAARILDPIFTGADEDGGKENAYGKFFKDYRESEW